MIIAIVTYGAWMGLVGSRLIEHMISQLVEFGVDRHLLLFG